MNFMDIVRSEKAKLAEVVRLDIDIETEPSSSSVLTDSDIPESMPLTNRLDKMTVDQGAWAIRNGTAWIAYLKANGVEVYQSPATASATDIEVTPAEVHNAICQTFENVWLAMLKESGGGTLELEQILD